MGVVELESTTSTMSTWRSNQLSYTPGKRVMISFIMLPNIYRKIVFCKLKIKKKSVFFAAELFFCSFQICLFSLSAIYYRTAVGLDTAVFVKKLWGIYV